MVWALSGSGPRLFRQPVFVSVRGLQRFGAEVSSMVPGFTGLVLFPWAMFASLCEICSCGSLVLGYEVVAWPPVRPYVDETLFGLVFQFPRLPSPLVMQRRFVCHPSPGVRTSSGVSSSALSSPFGYL